MIYLLTTPLTFTPAVGEKLVRYKPDMTLTPFMAEDVTLVGRSEQADDLVTIVDNLLFYQPAMLDVWIVDQCRWVAVLDRAGKWIQEVPAPFELEEYA